MQTPTTPPVPGEPEGQLQTRRPRPGRPEPDRRARQNTRDLRGPSTRAGRASLAGRTGASSVLVVLAVVATAGLAYFGLRSGDSVAANGETVSVAPAAPGSRSAAPDAPSASAAPATGPDAGTARIAAERGPVATGGIEVGEPAAWTRLEKTFTGTGTIAVDLRGANGAPVPAEWTLHLVPSPLAEGREHAQRRTRTFTRGETSIEEIDLPMGAYRVYATAAGLSSPPQEVVLHKLAGHEHLPGVSWIRVAVTLARASVVSGVLHDSRGRGAPECAVALREVGGERVLETVTAVNGAYRFDEVPPGGWALWIGESDRPLLPASRVDVAAEDIELPLLRLLPLVELELRAVDYLERPVPDVELSGHLAASGKGQFRGVSDALGRLRVRYLPPGPWRFEGTHAVLGLEGRLDLELALEGDGRDGADADGVQHVTLFLAKR
jgi:hypothetical protein